MFLFNQSLTTKYFDPGSKFTWISTIFLIKGIFFIFFFPYEIIEPKMIGLIGGDTSSYFLPIETLLKSGQYSPEYRMPGYGWIYLLLRLVFDTTMSYNIIILLQWTLSSLSVYYLAKSVLLITKEKFLFYITLFLYLISTSTNVLDYYLLTESFTTSALIFSCYYFGRYLNEHKKILLFISGSFICWGIFMRPVLLPILGIFIVIIVTYLLQTQTKINLIATCVFSLCLPFLICDTLWTVRNYIHHNKFAPLTTTYYPLDLENTYLNELMGFVISWGGDRSWWNPVAEIRWFIDNEKLFGPYTKELPEYIYTSAFTRDSLLHIRSMIIQIENPTTDSLTKATTSIVVRKKLKKFTSSIREEKPLLYYVTSRLHLFNKFVFHSGTPWLFKTKYSDLRPFHKLVKVFYTFLYYVVLIVGSTGILISLVQRSKLPTGFLIFPALSIYLILIYPLLGHIEYRYLIPLYPLLLVCTSHVIFVVVKRGRT